MEEFVAAAAEAAAGWAVSIAAMVAGVATSAAEVAWARLEVQVEWERACPAQLAAEPRVRSSS